LIRRSFVFGWFFPWILQVDFAFSCDFFIIATWIDNEMMTKDPNLYKNYSVKDWEKDGIWFPEPGGTTTHAHTHTEEVARAFLAFLRYIILLFDMCPKSHFTDLYIRNGLDLEDTSDSIVGARSFKGNGKMQISYSFMGSLFDDFDLTTFPFDAQDFRIVVTTGNRNISFVRYLPQELTPAEKPAEKVIVEPFELPEWKFVSNSQVTIGSTKSNYSLSKSQYPCCAVTMVAVRDRSYFVWNLLFPVRAFLYCPLILWVDSLPHFTFFLASFAQHLSLLLSCVCLVFNMHRPVMNLRRCSFRHWASSRLECPMMTLVEDWGSPSPCYSRSSLSSRGRPIICPNLVISLIWIITCRLHLFFCL
jgi:hypothetical protein